MRRISIFLFSLVAAALVPPLFSQEVLRGEVKQELEPVYAIFMGYPSPLDRQSAARWALEDSASAFSGMIYGWTFEYEPGERARGISENIVLTALGEVNPGDPRLKVSDTRIENGILSIWSDYYLSSDQSYRVRSWNSQNMLTVNSSGYAPLHGNPGITERKMIKYSALEDAAGQAIRAYMRKQIKNRPRVIKGSIALAAFPVFSIVQSRWIATGRFRLHVSEIVPFAAY